MCEIKYHVKLPIFVARQWIRHRTANVNEYSARYSILDNEFYLPQPQHLAAQTTTNAQGRGAVLDDAAAERVLDLLREDAERAYAGYAELLNQDAAGAPLDPDSARPRARARPHQPDARLLYAMVLEDRPAQPACTSCHCAPIRMRSTRSAPTPKSMLDTVERWVPMTYAAFLEYRMNAATISATGLAVIRRLVAGETVTRDESGLSAREWRELMALLGRPA